MRRFYYYKKDYERKKRSYQQFNPETAAARNSSLSPEDYKQMERLIGTKAMKKMGIKRATPNPPLD